MKHFLIKFLLCVISFVFVVECSQSKAKSMQSNQQSVVERLKKKFQRKINHKQKIKSYKNISSLRKKPHSNGASILTYFIIDFESAEFPPVGWSLVNLDSDYTWEKSSSASSFGVGSSSAYINFYDYS